MSQIAVVYWSGTGHTQAMAEAVAKACGAQELITACPLCMYNLRKNSGSELPVYYFTELLAEALGLKEENTDE